MQRNQALATVETQYLIRDLDEAIRASRRGMPMPWTLQKTTLRVFDSVLEYPVPADYDELAYLDKDNNSFYPASARFKFTSLQQFYENPDYRNDIAEIRDANETFLGVRFRGDNVTSQLLSDAEDSDDFTASGDATAVAEETVIVKKGNGSIKVTITSSASTATVKNTFNSSFTDANYKQKYHFKWVYLDAVPTSIKLRFQVDDSNYLETTGITTQFSGQPLKADAWNLVAHDLNTATATGTVSTSSTWASEKIILLGASTGTYYIDDSHLRKWSLLDFWYYSRYNVALVASTTANQEYFYNSSEVYSTDSKLVGDSEWIDVIMYDAMLIGLNDKKEFELMKDVAGRMQNALNKLISAYPSMQPLMITTKYRLSTDFNEEEDILYD